MPVNTAKFYPAQKAFGEMREKLRQDYPGITDYGCEYQAYDENVLTERWLVVVHDKVKKILVEYVCIDTGQYSIQVFVPLNESNEDNSELQALSVYLAN